MKAMQNKNIIAAWLLLLTFTLASCGSKVESAGNSNDVAYNPSTLSSYEVISYSVILNRLLVDFKLSDNSQAVNLLDDDKVFFSRTNLTYDPVVAIKFNTIMAQACHDMDTETLFPNGAKIDTAWVALTGRPIAEGKQVESNVLAKLSSQPEDVKIYGLCMAASLNAGAIFVNYL